MATCGICKTEMYQSSNGSNECRNFDCPPGTQGEYQRSWALVKKWKAILRRENAACFTVEELSLLLQRDNSGKEDGTKMQKIAERIGLGEDSQP